MRSNILVAVVMGLSLGLTAGVANATVYNLGNILAEADSSQISFYERMSTKSATEYSNNGTKRDFGTTFDPVSSNSYAHQGLNEKVHPVSSIDIDANDIDSNVIRSYGPDISASDSSVKNPSYEAKPFAMTLTGLGLVFLSVLRKKDAND